MTHRARFSIALVAALAPVVAVAPVEAQLASDFSVTVAPNYRAFSLDESLRASSASLLLLPVAVQVPLGNRFSVDAYSAYASGSVETEAGTLELSGPVDTQVRGTWGATSWARVTIGLNLPTGHGTHSAEEAEVAAVLSTDLLGFREARFGTGMGVTTGVALAHRLGDWGLGYGASYRLTGEFEPSDSTSAVYSPGDEIVARVAADRNVGTSGKFTLGATYQHFSEDEAPFNLFQPGARIRGDASYAFRAGSSATMSVFLTDVWRQQGEVSLLAAPDSVAATVGSQNLLIVGAGMSLGGALQLAPRADLRILSHEDGTGSGWVGGAGVGMTTRAAGIQLMPRVRVMFGGIESDAGESQGMTGFEVELAARF
jgi:hypothetical protein